MRNAEEQNAGIEAVVIAGSDEADVGKVCWRKEDGEWDFGVHDEAIGVEVTGIG